MSDKNLTLKKAFALGVKSYENNNLQNAQNYYQRVLEIDPNYAQAHNNLGVIFTTLEKNQKAKDCYEKAIEIDPNYAYAHNNLGRIFKTLGENQKAKDCYEKAIEIDPNYVDAYNNLGLLCLVLEENQKSIRCFEKIIEINPNHIPANKSLEFIRDRQKILSEIEKNKKFKNENKISFVKKIFKKLTRSDLRLNKNPFISYREVKQELIDCLYKLNNKSFSETNDIFFGNGKHSENFKIFNTDNPILKKVEDDLTNIMKQAVKSNIFIIDSFFNILSDDNKGGSKWHVHTTDWDKKYGLVSQKYSLTYHVVIGNQKSTMPGILRFKNPKDSVLPSEGMVMIFPANRYHSAIYNGKKDRIMLGVNFYSLI
jgi:tetratricopeptide (TPR) repeat protein